MKTPSPEIENINKAKKYYKKLLADEYTDQNAFDLTVNKFGSLTAQEISIATDRQYQGI